MSKKSIQKIILLNSIPEPNTGCWLWLGDTNERGTYGRYKGNQAHILAYEAWIKTVPAGKQLHHTCIVSLCVNPYHLQPVGFREHQLLHGKIKITDEQVVIAFQSYQQGESQRAIAIRMGISQPTLSSAFKRRLPALIS